MPTRDDRLLIDRPDLRPRRAADRSRDRINLHRRMRKNVISHMRAAQGIVCVIAYGARPCDLKNSIHLLESPSAPTIMRHTHSTRAAPHTLLVRRHTRTPHPSADTTVHIRRPGASPGHQHAQLSAYERIDAGVVAGRPLERSREPPAGGLCPAPPASSTPTSTRRRTVTAAGRRWPRPLASAPHT